MANKTNDSETKIKTEQGAVKIEPPKDRRKSAVQVLVSPSPVSGFVGFLQEHAIVGLAVGFIVGTQMQQVVTPLTQYFISPLVGLVLGSHKNLQDTVYVLHVGHRAAILGWGAVVYAIINLLLVLATLYALIKIFRLDKLDKPKK